MSATELLVENVPCDDQMDKVVISVIGSVLYSNDFINELANDPEIVKCIKEKATKQAYKFFGIIE